MPAGYGHKQICEDNLILEYYEVENSTRTNVSVCFFGSQKAAHFVYIRLKHPPTDYYDQLLRIFFVSNTIFHSQI